jgi:F-type H+-transporting ATPase subunit b
MTLPLFVAESGGLLEMVQATGETFGFNPYGFFAQCTSFLIVCILLQKFAYKPILGVLEQRRHKIEQSLADARKIKEQLAESEKSFQETLAKANAQAQKMIDEARASSQALADKRAQQAIAEAEQIIAKAHEATKIEHAQMLAELKAQVTRLVIDATTRVTGKILTEEDHRRLSEEAARDIAA